MSNKEELLENLGQLVRSQTYQCYKGKPLKTDMRVQKKNIEAIAKLVNSEIWDKELLALFMEMNAHDINEEFVIDTLKLKL